ncbi:MAG: DPP IV N-terminal domain-containing protein [Bryobacterales bacterium]|nr:DPP IV N-terminal domain-containing protein [Bryobacterales bacterium]
MAKLRSGLCGLLLAAVGAAQGTLADYERSVRLAEKWRPYTAGMTGAVRWIGETGRFWYQRNTSDGHEFVVGDTTGETRAAFDHERLAKALGEASGRSLKAARLALTEVEFSARENSVEFTLGEGVRWKADLGTYTVKRLWQREARFGAITGPRVAEGTGPVESPDGGREAFVRNYNVWLREKASKKEWALSSDGSEGNYYTLGGAVWSPDGKKMAVYRVRPGQRRRILYIESSPADQVQPRTRETAYVKPGDALDIPRPVLFDVVAGRQVEVEATLFANPYAMSRIRWYKDSRAFTFEYNQRGHQVYRVVEVDAATGQARAVVEERSGTFFCYYSKLYAKDVDDGREWIWMSERDGWNHLYLYDGAPGKVKNRITQGEWVVRTVLGVDEKRRQIYFTASGMDAGKDPYFRHLFRVGFDGGGLRRLTEGDADHNVSLSPDFEYFTAERSRVDMAPVLELRRTRDGSVVKTLEKVDEGALRSAGWRGPEVLTAKGRDGKTDIWGVLYRPSQFEAGKKYPVLEYIYAGPHDSFVPKTFAAAHPMQAVAELGFIVVQMDGMGTSNRSKAFHDVCWKNIGDAGFADRILWHKAAAAKYAWYDAERLGIYGHSAGGQNSLGALLRHGDFYKAAASSAGCHDNRMDKISWNEQWMGWPVGAEYAASSNVEMADKLKGKLLLAVGELDTNVDPASTMQVVNALIRAGKTFDLLFLPGAGHGGWGDYWDRKRADFFVEHLLGVKPPDWNAVTPPGVKTE